jgi:hypothetical protein
MDEKKKDKKRRAAILMKQLLEPLYSKLETIDAALKKDGIKIARYYRNKDLKKLFGLSSNTIIKYRQNGTLPFTRLGDIFLYDAAKVDKILKDNII